MKRSIELHGHRGARGLFPENTLAGFAATLAIGVDALELDVAVTADNAVVVTHDAHLNPDITRGLDGVWLPAPGPPIRSLRVAALAAYDVGRIRPDCAYAASYPDQTPHDGARIPRLREVFALDPLVTFNVELKSFPEQPGVAIDGAAMAELVVAEADAAGVTDRLIVQSFDWRGPRWLRTVRPEIRLAWLTRCTILPQARIWWGGPHPDDFAGSVPRAVAAEGGPTWGPEYLDLSEMAIAEAHALGLRVVPWTVNHPRDMHRLLHWGVDGLITDRPDLARSVLTEMGLPLPPPRAPIMVG